MDVKYKRKTVEGRASEFDFIQLSSCPTLFFHGDIRDSRKYDTFRGKQAVLFINLLGKVLIQEINGDGDSIWWAPDINDWPIPIPIHQRGPKCWRMSTKKNKVVNYTVAYLPDMSVCNAILQRGLVQESNTTLHVISLAVRNRQWNALPAKFKITWRHSNRPIRWPP